MLGTAGQLICYSLRLGVAVRLISSSQTSAVWCQRSDICQVKASLHARPHPIFWI